MSQYQTLELGVAFGITDVGTVRASNQDHFHVAPELNLLAVADGMGGHEAGEIASAEAIRLLCDYLAGQREHAAPHARPAGAPEPADPDATWTGAALKAVATLHDAVAYANAHLYQANLAHHHAEGTGMGTTLTGMWQPVPGGPALIFHVGDSRLYCWRAGALTQLTRDQTLYQQALDLHAPPPLPPRNLLLQAVGPGSFVQPELITHTVAPGDVYLLCSDGLHGETPAAALAGILADARPDNLHACCAGLVAMAKRDGSRDNITAVLLRC
ncbi:PP2C family protein-serine/threonine phosphatase [Pseudoduganella flava]|uniref:Serine/threonine-protein phosphatase n=1 Tax=Pseudoduganella flava TaxID=871742 RepID=A0ABX6FZ64_9BURK|nr:protein phosphatase 2C domain-containing protein [Pseudoduganella flava]QGZ42807.1 serine/threonine-protein phosphatase [Pseudoduganella flava]